MNKLTQEAKYSESWKNYHYLNGKGDFDADDMVVYNGQFQEFIDLMKANIVELEAIAAIPDVNLTTYLANNDQYLIDNPSIDLTEYDKRYQV